MSLTTRSADFQSNDTRLRCFATAPSSCPGGTSENSPTFQRWEPVPGVTLVPKGRLNPCACSAVPSGLTAPYARRPNVETLGYYQKSLRDEDQILVALDVQSAVSPISNRQGGQSHHALPAVQAPQTRSTAHR